MKKISLLAKAILCLGIAAQAQTPFFEKTDYVGAMGKTDWTAKWANFRPDTVHYADVTTEVTGEITSNTTWTADKVYHLTGFVYVKNGATLTIQPGTVIRATKNGTVDAGALIITRGCKIMAEGTAEKPIVFTSDKPIGQRHLGDWGGVMLFGMARQNQPKSITGDGKMPADYRETNFEVFPESNKDIWYGGNNDADNSGVLKYVRIEFAGWYQVVNSEINGLTFGAVGSGTTIDYVQCSNTNDDSFEWFGGTVNCKHMIAYAGIDDDFDTDCGYRGMIQFGIGLRNPLNWDASSGGGSRGFESDNNTSGTTVANETNPKPITAPIFSNMTLVGPIYPGKNANMLRSNHQFVDGIRIRTNSSLSVFNSVEMGFPAAGFTLHHWDKTKNPSVYSKAAFVDSITVHNLIFANNTLNKAVSPAANVPTGVVYPLGNTTFDTKQWLMQATFNNDTSITNSNDLNLTYPMVDTVLTSAFKTPSVMPKEGSKVLAGASFLHPKLASNLIIAGINNPSETNLAVTASPNPVDGYTVITYTLLSSSNVDINIYDMTGKVVAQLESGSRGAGEHSVEFNSKSLTSGLYIAKVNAGSVVKTIKLSVK